MLTFLLLRHCDQGPLKEEFIRVYSFRESESMMAAWPSGEKAAEAAEHSHLRTRNRGRDALGM